MHLWKKLSSSMSFMKECMLQKLSFTNTGSITPSSSSNSDTDSDNGTVKGNGKDDVQVSKVSRSNSNPNAISNDCFTGNLPALRRRYSFDGVANPPDRRNAITIEAMSAIPEDAPVSRERRDAMGAIDTGAGIGSFTRRSSSTFSLNQPNGKISRQASTERLFPVSTDESVNNDSVIEKYPIMSFVKGHKFALNIAFAVVLTVTVPLGSFLFYNIANEKSSMIYTLILVLCIVTGLFGIFALIMINANLGIENNEPSENLTESTLSISTSPSPSSSPSFS